MTSHVYIIFLLDYFFSGVHCTRKLTQRDESKLRIDALEDRVRQLEKHDE